MTRASDPQIARATAQIAAGYRPIVKAFFDEVTFTARYVVHDPASKHAGHLPAAEENGMRYLKIPLDAL
jgi:hypothetical protein